MCFAAVPGMVAGTLRHLRSLRRMERDRGFINMLLNEAENERMHLQTFVKIKSPSYFFRLIIIGAQGVFYNLFFLAYLISPRLAHRFVAYLEEEAVHTYTKCIEELERGHIPEVRSHSCSLGDILTLCVQSGPAVNNKFLRSPKTTGACLLMQRCST